MLQIEPKLHSIPELCLLFCYRTPIVIQLHNVEPDADEDEPLEHVIFPRDSWREEIRVKAFNPIGCIHGVLPEEMRLCFSFPSLVVM